MIDGVQYFTSLYFANNIHVAKKTARNFLSKYDCVPNHPNPKLYSEQTMAQAFQDYENQSTNRRVFAGQKLEILQEYVRVLDEEHEEKKLSGKSTSLALSSPAAEIGKDDNVPLKLNMILSMLRHLLTSQGYSFDEKRYTKDALFDIEHEGKRECGSSRSIEHRAAIKRLNSSSAYLIKK